MPGKGMIVSKEFQANGPGPTPLTSLVDPSWQGPIGKMFSVPHRFLDIPFLSECFARKKLRLHRGKILPGASLPRKYGAHIPWSHGLSPICGLLPNVYIHGPPFPPMFCDQEKGLAPAHFEPPGHPHYPVYGQIRVGWCYNCHAHPPCQPSPSANLIALVSRRHHRPSYLCLRVYSSIFPRTRRVGNPESHDLE